MLSVQGVVAEYYKTDHVLGPKVAKIEESSTKYSIACELIL